MKAKMVRKLFHSLKRKTTLTHLIHANICDLKFVRTRDGNRYFITFIHDCTRYFYIYFLRNKDDAIEYFKIHKNEFGTQLNKKIKAVRSDKGGEYDSTFKQFCSQYRIVDLATAP